jgi:hypothetical protein
MDNFNWTAWLGAMSLMFLITVISRKVNGNTEFGFGAFFSQRRQCSQCLSWVAGAASKCRHCGSIL